MSRKTIAKISGIACGIVGFLNTAHGATFNVSWDGGATGSYNTAVNWSTNTVPLNVEPLNDYFNVTINRAGGANVTGNLTQIEILNLSIGANAGNQLTLADNCTLNLIGTASFGPTTATNAGTIQLGLTAAAASQLRFLGSTNTLSGGGTISMIGANTTFFSSGPLTSDNTIIGFGSVSTNNLMTNNGTVTASGGSLTIDAGGIGGFDNNLLLQSIGGGTLVLDGTGGGSFVNSGATIANNGGRINLINGAQISGGTITTLNLAGTSIFFIPGGESATLTSVTSAADVNVGINSTLSLTGTITNNGRIRTNSGAGVATYNLGSSTVTLNGIGSLNLAAITTSAGNVVGTGTLVNGPTHSILGGGTIGNSTLAVRNQGTISTNAGGHTLTLNPGAGGFTNTGTILATSGATLTLSGGSFGNFSGTISNSGGRVNLVDQTVIAGGTLVSADFAGNSLFHVPAGETAQLGSGVNVNAEVVLEPTSTIRLGAVTNNGLIRVNPVLGSATFTNATAATMTLNGTGSLLLSAFGGTDGYIGGGGTFLNGNSHSIVATFGQGTLGDGSTTIRNNGTISVPTATAGLFLVGNSTGTGLFNVGTITSANQIEIRVPIVSNTGTIAAASGGRIKLQGTTIDGGTLQTAASGEISLLSLSSTLSNGTVVNNGRVALANGSTLTLNSMFVQNTGSISLGSAAAGDTLRIDSGTTTLAGTGLVQIGFAGAPADSVLGTGTLHNLTNTIAGTGTLGVNDLTIVNAGTIAASLSGGTLTIQPGPGGLTNTGTLTSVNNSDLNLSGGTINNTGGMIFANNSGINLRNNVFITGGTLNNVSGGPNIFVPGGSTATIANLTNDGVFSVSSASAGTLNLAGTITNNGRINIVGTAVMTVSGGTATLAGAGSISLTGTIMGVGTLGNSSNQIRGLGAISVAKLINGSNGTVSADQSGQTLRLIASNFLVNYENQGIMRATNGGILQLESGFFGGGHINIGDGTMLAENASTLRLEATGLSGGTLSTSGTGSIDINSSSISNLTLNGNVIHDSGTLTIGTLVTNNGSITTLNGLNVEISNQVPSTLVNNGTMSLSSGTIAFSQILGGGTLVNTGRIAGNFRIDPSGTATFAITNSGLMETTAAGETVSWDNQGSTPLAITANHTGTLRANSGGSILINSGVLVIGDGTVDVRSGANFATGGTVTLGSVTNDGTALVVNTANLGRVSGAGTMNVGFALLGTQIGNVTVTHLRQSTVNLFNGSTITTATGGGTLGTSRVTNFNTINTGTGAFAGRWNLSNHDLVVDYAVSSPFGSVLALVQQGFAGGAWTGNGLTSSAAQAAESTSDKTGLAIVEAGELFPSFPRDFSGQSIDSTTVLVKYTLLGDTNLDSLVNITDFAALAANFNTGGRWNRGDFNYDSQINIADFALLASNFNKSLPVDLPRGGLVPEPTVAVLGLAVIATLRRSRRA